MTKLMEEYSWEVVSDYLREKAHFDRRPPKTKNLSVPPIPLVEALLEGKTVSVQLDVNDESDVGQAFRNLYNNMYTRGFEAHVLRYDINRTEFNKLIIWLTPSKPGVFINQEPIHRITTIRNHITRLLEELKELEDTIYPEEPHD